MAAPTFNRSDTMLGVCEAIGQDLGVHPNWLRVALALGVFWSPVAMFATYLALGAAVLVARRLTPERTPTARPVATPEAFNDDEGQVMWAEAA